LEGEIEELKVLDDEELKKLAKMEEVQVLQANIHVLERQLDFERGQWTKLQEKCGNMDSQFFCSRSQISIKTGSLRFGKK
jgi:hypothetical protein